MVHGKNLTKIWFFWNQKFFFSFAEKCINNFPCNKAFIFPHPLIIIHFYRTRPYYWPAFVNTWPISGEWSIISINCIDSVSGEIVGLEIHRRSRRKIRPETLNITNRRRAPLVFFFMFWMFLATAEREYNCESLNYHRKSVMFTLSLLQKIQLLKLLLLFFFFPSQPGRNAKWTGARSRTFSTSRVALRRRGDWLEDLAGPCNVGQSPSINALKGQSDQKQYSSCSSDTWDILSPQCNAHYGKTRVPARWCEQVSKKQKDVKQIQCIFLLWDKIGDIFFSRWQLPKIGNCPQKLGMLGYSDLTCVTVSTCSCNKMVWMGLQKSEGYEIDTI